MIDNKEKLRKIVFRSLSASRLPQMLRPLLGGEGAILMAHRVTAAPGTKYGFNSNLIVHPEFLDELIAEMKAQGFGFVSLDEAVDRIGKGRDGGRFAAITLDDGFRDNLTEALPVFEKHGTPFTVFIAPGLTDGDVEPWWEIVEAAVERSDSNALEMAASGGVLSFDCSTDEAKADAFEEICRVLSEEIDEADQVAAVRGLAGNARVDCGNFRQAHLMNWDEIRGLSAHPLCAIGAHTINHYNLRRLSRENALWEMSDSAAVLEERLGERPRHFAYPYGFEKAVGEREAQLAKLAGFKSAVTTRHGVIQKEHAGHLHTLPRISVNGRYQNIDYLNAMLSGVTTPMANRGRTVVTV
ncbi:polysaccharide deacetylase family protein [Hoeflea poritis]|uniref:Chitooligosaccharide deacetylase n=1 Tax=Hoeflea poritis TaxID=2993659 RepID=A0ABT4VJY4_9HYPH|nr:polysaccharide deacetylase family protein [Hoeflea poritis]MDA4844914.1 polysaccharide deacetylase family protein [Hoeflea poritis]